MNRSMVMTMHIGNEKHPVYYRHDDKPVKHPKTHKVLPDVPTQIYNIRNRQVAH
jgi:hypothetical protein